MITYYSVFLLLTTIGTGIRCQYLLANYAPDHDNYEPASYSFAYGVNDPISGDQKHQWERMENGYVHGEYGFMEPDGLMRLVKYKAGPKEGFQATVSKLAVQVARPQFTLGTELYTQTGEKEFRKARYAENDTPLITQNAEQISGNLKPEYVLQDYIQLVNKPNKRKSDYINQENRQDIISPFINHNYVLNRRKKDLSPSSRRSRIVKKNNNAERHFMQPGFSGEIDYISNFNLNPISIHQLNIPEGEKKILHELSVGEAQPLIFESHRIPTIVQHPKPILPSIQNPIQTIHPALVQFQKDIGHSSMFGYQVVTPVQISHPELLPNHQILNQNTKKQNIQYNIPVVQTNLQNLHRPIQALSTSAHNIKQLHGNENYEDKRLQSALETIHNHPNIKLTLEHLQKHTGYVPEEQRYENPKILNNNNFQIYSNNANQQYNENKQIYRPNKNYQNTHLPMYDNTNLSQQNEYPIILLNPDGKLGLPFYPSSQEIHAIPQQEYNYEDIPQFGPNLEGKRYGNENQTEEEKEEQRQYLLGLRPGRLFPAPKGYTQETIWQAGDPDADPEPEVLVRQPNETCAYIQFNETSKGNEDGSRDNIWNAGDYSAQKDEEELIRSVNITCENYTSISLSNFSSGYNIVDYCWQCVKTEDNGRENQNTYETTLENYRQQPVYETQQQQQEQQEQQNAEENSENGDNYYEEEQGPMKVALYQNFGYRNDPESLRNTHYKRSSENQNISN